MRANILEKRHIQQGINIQEDDHVVYVMQRGKPKAIMGINTSREELEAEVDKFLEEHPRPSVNENILKEML